MANTGIQKVIQLRLFDLTTDEYTSTYKNNIPGDPNYVPDANNIEDCPITYALTCPVIVASAKGVGNIEVEFSIDYSVYHNPSLHDIVMTLTAGMTSFSFTFPLGSFNYFHHIFTGLANGTAYTISCILRNSGGSTIATCAGLKTVTTTAADTITWAGINPFCDKTSTCGEGFTYNSDLNICEKIETVDATPPSGGGGSPGTVTKVSNTQWNNGGAQIFADGYPLSGDGTVATRLLNPHLWVNGNFQWDGVGRNTTDSRMNKAGIWCTPEPGTFEWVGFSRKLIVATAKTVLIGMSADNAFRFTLNGTDLVKVPDTGGSAGYIGGGPNFNFWNIYRVSLPVGDNYIEMWAENFGGPAGMAAEIYDCTEDQLAAVTDETGLNAYIIFSTKDLVGESFDLGETVGYSCPATYSLDHTGDVYSCKRVTTATPSTTNTGTKEYTNRERLVNSVPDGYTEPNTDGGGLGPYIAPVTDLTFCPT